MHAMVRRHAATVPALVLFLLTTCQRVNSPYLDTYVGDYHLAASWSTPADSFDLFTPYAISYENTGADTFTEVAVTTHPAGCIDTAYLAATRTDSTFSVYFTRPGPLTVRIGGVRPNEKTVVVDLTAAVRNRFLIAGARDTLTGSTVRLSIPSATAPLSVRWYEGATLLDSSGTTRLALTQGAPGARTLHAMIHDTLGNRVSTDTVTIRFRAPTPYLQFPADSMEAPVGQQIAITLTTSDCDSVRWRVKRLGIEATTTGPLSVVFGSTGPDTVIATPLGSAGAGAPDTLYVRALHYTYSLIVNRSEFPDTVRARAWSTWQVAVTKNGAAYTGSDIVYRWTVTPDSSPDSLKTSSAGDTLSLFFGDSIRPPVVSVRALVGADSTYLHSAPVVVRRFAPSIAFTVANVEAKINEPCTLTIDTRDSNSDGAIAAAYYRTSDDTAAISTAGEKRLTVAFLTPGLKTIRCWAIDNDHFTSDTASATVRVTANRPYFTDPDIDTTVFVNDSLHLVLSAVPGNALDSIVSYLWDWGANGTVEKTTHAGRYDTLFTVPCTALVRVDCRDKLGDSAAAPARVRLIVREGAPVVRSVALTPLLTYIGTPVKVRVVASDTNGVVTRIAVRVNGGADTVFTVRRAQYVDTSFPLDPGAAGRYRIEAAAIDDDQRRSAWTAPSESLTVSDGFPVVGGISPTTVWVNDEVQYTVSAADVNGTVKLWQVQWQPAALWVISDDSLFSYRYTSPGVKQVRLLAFDNENRRSDTLIDTIVVRLGRPRAAAVFPDSIWIFDTASYTVAGLDTNGTVAQWAISWDTGLPFAVQTDSVFSHAYTTDGIKSLRAFVVDDDQVRSDTVAAQVFVKLGRPRIAAVTTDSARGGIFVRDSIPFRVKGSDPNGLIDSVVVVWAPGEIDRRKAAGDSVVVKHAFGVAQSGSRVVKITARDNDGIWADTVYDTVAVRVGTPLVTAIAVDTPAQNLFIGDNRTFTVSFADTNGTIDSIKVDSGLGTFGAWRMVTGSLVTFTRTFAAGESGSRTVRVVVKDDDGAESEQFSRTLAVRLGAPVVWGDSGDTLWVVVDNGPGINYDLHVRSIDTNGLIVRYYWDERTTFDSTTLAPERKTDDSLFSRTIGAVEVNQGWPIWIYARDDDNLVRGGQFTVFADGPPPATVVVGPPVDSVVNAGGSVALRWKKDDVLDGKNTKFQVVLWSAAGDTTRADWTAGTTYFTSSDGTHNHYAYTFTPVYPASRTVFWRVDAKDARESSTKGGQAQFLYIKP